MALMLIKLCSKWDYKICSKWDYKNTRSASKSHNPNFIPREVLKCPNPLEI